MKYIFERYSPQEELKTIGEMHGKIFETTISKKKIKIIPLYHPAAAIYNQHLKETLKKDFLLLKFT